MNLPFEISNEDFFKLLKHKVHSSYSMRYVDGLAEKVAFKETIDTLKRISKTTHSALRQTIIHSYRFEY